MHKTVKEKNKQKKLVKGQIHFFTSGGRSTGVSALASVLPMNTQNWMDWLDLLEIQGTLKSLLPHHSSKASIIWRSAFFTVQLSHLFMTTGKTIALTRGHSR